MTWVYAIPVWLFAVGAILTATTLASAGLFYTRRIFPRRDEITHNDVAGAIVATLGTILAVVLSFMVVTVWQEYDQAAATVQNEVNALCDLYHDGATLPQPFKGQLQNEIRRYVNVTVNDEWPLMRFGRESELARRDAYDALVIVASFKPQNETQQAMQADMISVTHAFNDARRSRLFANAQIIPHIMWWMLFFISAITISSSYFFRVQNFRAHLIMTCALSAVIAAILVLIAEFDLPFRGDIQIQPREFSHVAAAIAADPPNSGYSLNGPKSGRP